MEPTNKYTYMLDASKNELAETVANWSEQEIKEFLQFLITEERKHNWR